MTVPSKASQYNDPKHDSYAAATLRKMVKNPAVAMDGETQKAMLQFWFEQWPTIPNNTRGNIVISLSTKLDRFKHGRLRNCFCDKTDIVPEMTFHGAVILMNMRVLTWNEDGVIGQQLFKYMWQRAAESRNGQEASQRERPIFLWADEAQYFVNVKDDEFFSVCRGMKVASVFLSQCCRPITRASARTRPTRWTAWSANSTPSCFT